MSKMNIQVCHKVYMNLDELAAACTSIMFDLRRCKTPPGAELERSLSESNSLQEVSVETTLTPCTKRASTT